MSIDSELLRTFVTFAELRSFTHAARALHLSQPAVHVHVKRLSASLGARLYERRGRELVLTPEGERTLAFAREMLERSDAFVRELAGDPMPGVVRLCAGEGAFLYLLGDALREAHRRGVRLSLRVADAASTLVAVQRGEAQLGVAPLALVPDGIEAAILAEASTRIAMPAGHPLAAKRMLSAHDLGGERLVVPPAGSPLREALDLVLRAANVPAEVAVEARGWPLVLRFVALGMGIGPVNDFCVLPRGVVTRRMRGLPRATYRVLRRAGAMHGADADALFHRMRRAAAGDRALRSPLV